MSVKVKSGIHKTKDFFRRNSKKMYVNGLAALTSVSFMTVPASAEGEAVSVTGGISTVVDLLGTIWTLISSNSYLLAYVAIGLVGAGFGLIKKAKKAVR